MKEIFEILEQNARATPEQISIMVDKPVSEVKKQSSKLRRMGPS